MQYHYRLYGLRIASEIELPELVAEDAWKEPDVRIRLESLPEPKGKSDELCADGEGAGFFIEGVAQYWVCQGREIFVDPELDAPARNVRLYLLGSALGLLLHQRGNLPLHANAIEINGRGYAFMGPSGSGKSTLAAAFHDHGYRVVADDVCVVSLDDEGLASAHCGVPRLRLKEDALAGTGRFAGNYPLSYAGDEQFRKFDVATRQAGRMPIPLHAVIALACGDELDCKRLGGVEAVEVVFANTYRGGFIASAGDAKAHWQACVQLVAAVPVFRLRRPLRPEAIPAIVAHFEDESWGDSVVGDLVANN